MNPGRVLNSANQLQLGQAVEENLFDLFRSMAKALGGEVEEGPRLCRHLSFPTNPMFKGVWRVRLADSDVESAIDETLDWFRARNSPYAFWWTGPDTRPSDLPARLRARGMVSMEGQQQELAKGILALEGGSPCMAMDLARANEGALKEVPRGFTIEEVTTEAGLQEFKRLFVDIYGIPDWAGQAWVDATLRIGIGRSPWRIYLGLLEGRAVATNMLFNGGGVASVYAVGTLGTVRGKGIGGAITLAPLLQSRDAGYRYGVLFSTAMGVGAYERIGFRKTGRTIDRYLWKNQ